MGHLPKLGPYMNWECIEFTGMSHAYDYCLTYL